MSGSPSDTEGSERGAASTYPSSPTPSDPVSPRSPDGIAPLRRQASSTDDDIAAPATPSASGPSTTAPMPPATPSASGPSAPASPAPTAAPTAPAPCAPAQPDPPEKSYLDELNDLDPTKAPDLETLRKSVKKAHDRDQNIGMLYVQGNYKKEMNPQTGKYEKKNYFKSADLDVELTYNTQSVPGFYNARDVDIKVKKGPAIVNLAMTNVSGKKIKKQFSIEYDKDGKAINSIPDLRLVKFAVDPADPSKPGVAYMDVDGERVVLPLNAKKVQELQKQIEERREKVHGKKTYVAKERGATPPPLPPEIDKEGLKASIGTKTAEEKTEQELSSEIYILLRASADAKLKNELRPTPENEAAFAAAEAKGKEYMDAHSGNTNLAKIRVDQIELAVKERLKEEGLRELQESLRKELKAKTPSDEREAQEAQKAAKAKLSLSGASSVQIKDTEKAMIKSEITSATLTEFAEKIGGRDGAEAIAIQEKAAEMLARAGSSRDEIKVARMAPVIEFTREAAKEEIDARVGKNGVPNRIGIADAAHKQKLAEDKLEAVGLDRPTIDAQMKHDKASTVGEAISSAPTPGGAAAVKKAAVPMLQAYDPRKSVGAIVGGVQQSQHLAFSAARMAAGQSPAVAQKTKSQSAGIGGP